MATACLRLLQYSVILYCLNSCLDTLTFPLCLWFVLHSASFLSIGFGNFTKYWTSNSVPNYSRPFVTANFSLYLANASLARMQISRIPYASNLIQVCLNNSQSGFQVKTIVVQGNFCNAVSDMETCYLKVGQGKCMYVCMYVKKYFVTLASSTLVGFHEGRRFKQSIYMKKKGKRKLCRRIQIAIGVTHTLA